MECIPFRFHSTFFEERFFPGNALALKFRLLGSTSCHSIKSACMMQTSTSRLLLFPYFPFIQTCLFKTCHDQMTRTQSPLSLIPSSSFCSILSSTLHTSHFKVQTLTQMTASPSSADILIQKMEVQVKFIQDMFKCLVFIQQQYFNLYCCTVQFVVYLSNIPTNAHILKKGKVIPITGLCGPEGGQRYSSTLP